jgi:hypothetical protein
VISFKTFLLESVSFSDISLKDGKKAVHNPAHAGYDWVIKAEEKEVGWINFSKSTKSVDGKKYSMVNSSAIDGEDYKKVLNYFLKISNDLKIDGIISLENNPKSSMHHDYKRPAKITEFWKQHSRAKKINNLDYILENK